MPFFLPEAGWTRRLDPEVMAGVEAICPPRRFRKGEALFLPGDPAESFYILVEGRVLLALPTPKGERALALLGEGDIFGESFLSRRERQVVSARVQSEVAVVCPVSRPQFLEVARTFPEVALMLAALLAERLTQLAEAMGQASLPAYARVGRLLLRLGESFGQPVPEGVRLELGLTQEDLAALCGVTRVTVAQAFRLFRQEGALRKDGAGYLLDPARLRFLVEDLEMA